jgi:hypothetical protein
LADPKDVGIPVDEPSLATADPANMPRVRPSWWFMLALPFGLTTWLMCVWLWAIERRSRWFGWAILYLALAVVPFVVAQSWAQHHLVVRAIGFLALPIAWIGGIVQGISTNRRINGRLARFDSPAYPVVRHPFRLFLTPPERHLYERFRVAFAGQPGNARVVRWIRAYGPNGAALLGVASLWAAISSWIGLFNMLLLMRTHSLDTFYIGGALTGIFVLVAYYRLRQVSRLGSVYLDGYAEGASSHN